MNRSGPDGPRPALLALSLRPQNVHLLQDLFGLTCDVLTGADLERPELTFDICLIDAFLHARHRRRLDQARARAAPVPLPVVGLITNAEATEALIAAFDEVIRLPCTKIELRNRVKNLLEMRRLAAEQQASLGRLRGEVRDLESERGEMIESERSLRNRTRDAEAASRTKSSFLANMSHEIRTPLGLITGFAALLEDPDLGSAQRAEYVDKIIRNGRALSILIDDILDLAKVEAGKVMIEIVPFSLAELIAECIELFADKAAHKGIFIRADVPSELAPRLRSDPTRLRQILVNLIGNAIKFTERGGVDVVVRHATGVGGRIDVEVAVRDTGIGLSTEQQARLFQPFAQADETTTRKFGGTGLGLNLSRRLARALGGDIVIRDCSPGVGCAFVLQFGASAGDGSRAASVETEPSADSLAGRRVLVVDDSEDNAFLARHLLTKLGAAVVTADCGEAALVACAREAFDCVLLDIQMPGLDGYDTLRALRQAGYVGRVVALTAHAMIDERERTRAAGFDDHVTKPILRSDLIGAVCARARVGP